MTTLEELTKNIRLTSKSEVNITQNKRRKRKPYTLRVTWDAYWDEFSKMRETGASKLSQPYRFIFEEIAKQKLTFQQIEKKAGVSSNTLSRWFNKGTQGSYFNTEAVLNTLGYTGLPPRKLDK
jgi:transcriptional regulator with XRE-family HTH domain